MKYKYLTFFILVTVACFSQQKLPVIKASSKAAIIMEDGQPATTWNLSPETKVDIYTTNKLTKPTLVKLKTDADSIGFNLKPGQHKDFIVLLNGKDTCYTRFQSPEAKNFSKLMPVIRDTIPFVINTQNTIYVKALLNNTDTLNLNFDTGTTELVLTNEILRSNIKSEVKLYSTPYSLKIGNRVYKAKIYDAELTGHDTDGRFGWDLFDGLVVELNYDKNIMVVHSKIPKGVKNNRMYAKAEIKYLSQIFFIEATISQSGIKNTDWYLFDTGYQRTAMLDNDLLKRTKFPVHEMQEISRVMMRGATGNEVPVITSNLQTLGIGKYVLNNIPAQLLTNSKPLRTTNVHLLGNEILKRFNLFLDFQDNVVYLKPNNLFDVEYIEKPGLQK